MARSSAQSAKRYPLTLMLGTEANIRLLRELTRHGGQLSASALEARTGLSGSTVRAGLAALLETGVVQAAGGGYGRLYSIPARHPFSVILGDLFRIEEERFSAILSAIETAARAGGSQVIAAWIYGSVARGEDRSDSDIDIAVIAEEQALVDVVATVRGHLVQPSETLGFVPSVVGLGVNDVIRLIRQRDPWWLGVAHDAVVLVGPRPDDLVRASRFAA